MHCNCGNDHGLSLHVVYMLYNGIVYIFLVYHVYHSKVKLWNVDQMSTGNSINTGCRLVTVYASSDKRYLCQC